jgi:hypothetical protein
MRLWIGVLWACVLAASNVSCARKERQNPQAVSSPAEADVYVSQIGSPVPPSEVWPIPPDATRTADGNATRLVRRGPGKTLPVLNRNVIAGIAMVEYSTRGEVISHVPFRVQAIDLTPAAWRDVLLQMHQGDVRRAWIHDAAGKFTIADIEVQRLVFPGPADYGPSRSK